MNNSSCLLSEHELVQSLPSCNQWTVGDLEQVSQLESQCTPAFSAGTVSRLWRRIRRSEPDVFTVSEGSDSTDSDTKTTGATQSSIRMELKRALSQ